MNFLVDIVNILVTIFFGNSSESLLKQLKEKMDNIALNSSICNPGMATLFSKYLYIFIYILFRPRDHAF